jgi:hypothetical protein
VPVWLSVQAQHGEIDLLAYKANAPKEVLLVEAKTILAVDETNEISGATDKLIRAQGQITDASSILKSLKLPRKADLFKFVDWTQANDYYMIVMTPECSPNTLYRDEIVPHVSYSSLLTYARPRDLSKPSRLWLFCRDKDWIKRRTSEKDPRYRDVCVGDITFELPYVIIDRPQNQKR